MAIALTHSANVGFANVSRTRQEARSEKIQEAVASGDTSDIMGNIKDMLGDAISPVAKSVSKVSEEVENLKNQKPKNARALSIVTGKQD